MLQVLGFEDVREFVIRKLEYVQGLVYHYLHDLPYVGDIIEKLPVWVYGVIIVLLVIGIVVVVYLIIRKTKQTTETAIRNSRLGDMMEKKKSLKYAESLMKEGNYLQAADAFSNAGNPKKAIDALIKGNMLDKAGKMYEKMGDFDKAIELYEKAGEHNWLADLLKQRGEYKRAGQLLESIGKKMVAADCYKEAGNHLKAAQLYAESGNSASAADCFERAGELRRAGEMYERAYVEATASQELPSAEMQVKLDEMINKAARFYGESGDHMKAAVTYYKVRNYLKAGESAVKAGDNKRAADYFREGRHYEEAAQIFRQGGDESTAAEILAQKFMDKDNYAEAGKLYLQAGSYMKAADVFSQCGEILLAAEAYMKAEQYADAAEYYMEAGEKLQAAEAFHRSGDPKRAVELYLELGEVDKATALVDESGDPMLAADVYKSRGETNKELSALQKVPKEDYRYNDAVARTAEIFVKQGNVKLAEDKLSQTIGESECDSFNVILYFTLGMVYEHVKRYREAVLMYDKVQMVDYGFRDVEARVEKCRPLAEKEPPPQQEQESLAQQARQQAVSQQIAQDRQQPAGEDPAKRYKVMAEVGRGGMGVVYKAMDKNLNRVIAIKVLPKSISDNPKMVKRFSIEARSAASLNHPNIVTLYDFQQGGGRSFLTMEFVEGITLKKYMGMTKKIPLINTLKIIYQCCQGLDYAHKKGIVHRDIKPSNIMINKQNVVKIMDFGLAKVAGEETITEAGSLSGTVMYMSPEQLVGEKLEATTDIYSLGLVFYELVTGSHPFPEGDVAYHHVHSSPKPPKEIRPEIPDVLNDIILKSITKDRTKRFQSAIEFAQSLRQVPVQKQ